MYPIRVGIVDFRQEPIDTTAGFDLKKDLAIAEALHAASPDKSYFELYDLYCTLAKSWGGADCKETPQTRKAEAHYRQVLAETHLKHGQAILEKASWYSTGIGRLWTVHGIALEDGAGLGQFVYGFAKRFEMVVVLDISLCYLLLCQKLIEEQGMRNAIPLCGNVERLPIQDETIAFVHFNNMIEHVHNPRAALSEAYRVLEEEGLAFVVSPNRLTLYMEPHFRCPAFGFFPRWLQDRLAWWCRGVESVDGIHLRSLGELQVLLRDAWKEPCQVSFLPRYLPQTVRQTPVRKLVVWGLRSRIIGPTLHVLFNKLLLGVMPYHVALCFKTQRTDARGQASHATPQAMGIAMLATKFYAQSDMGGGLERSARRLFRHLVEAGYRVVVLTRNYDRLPRREELDGVLVERFPIWGRSQVMVSLSYLLQALWWLMTHRRDYELIHCHQSYAPATVGALAKLLLGRPVVVKISTSDEFSERRQLEQLPFLGIRRVLLKRVDRFVAVNPSAQHDFAKLGIDPAKITHVPNGVPLPDATALDLHAKQEARTRLGLGVRQLVLFVGRLSAEKNLSHLIEAWPEVLTPHPEAHLVLVGDGGTFRNVEGELKRQVEQRGLQGCVHFMGRVSEVQDYLLAADLFVLPSITEGMSNALLEAMAVGLPIVATRIAGNLELIQDGTNGRLVDVHDATQLACAIADLLDSPEEACRLGQAARRTIEARFTIQRTGQTYQALYTELLEKQARR